MPTPKKTNSKTVAKEVPAFKKKTCGKSRQEEMLQEKGV